MKYTVWRSNETDEFIHGTYETMTDAFKQAYKLWWTYTTKEERKKQEVYITEDNEFYPDVLNIRVNFSSKQNLLETLRIIELYREAYDCQLPTEEVKMICDESEIDDREDTKAEVIEMISRMDEIGEFISEYLERITHVAGLGEAFDEDIKLTNGENAQLLYWIACDILGVEA